MKKSFTPLILLSLLSSMGSAYAIEKASEKRLDEVVRRGVHVMPFDLELTTHIFSKSENGGIQKVIVKDLANVKQIKLIREHLSKIFYEFQQGNFSNPEKIHGATMPGLEALRKAKPKDINFMYKDLPDGAEITYFTDNPNLITAIHQWFDAQLSDHSRHAISGHSRHQMHHK